jgi:hypothetical protein
MTLKWSDYVYQEQILIMEIDPIVEEIRRVRQEHAEKFNFDIDRICDDLEKEQDAVKPHSRVSRPPPDTISHR